MKAKPKGPEYRNLTARGGVIYYQRRVGGRRIRFSCQTDDWKKAASIARTYEERKGIGRGLVTLREPAPRFREVAARYLETATHLAESTLEDRRLLLGPEGHLVARFGERRVDEVTRADLLAWWEEDVEGAGRATNTGLNYLNSLAAVFGLAEDLEHVERSPVIGFRATLRRRRKTKRGRHEAELRDQRHPLESAEALRAFVEASRAARRLRFKNGRPVHERHMGHVADMLQLDAGLRLGEVAGLRWEHVHLGQAPTDSARRLVVVESRARGRYAGATKSGRGREVPLSQRLRRVLRDWWVAEGQPAPEAPVLPLFHPGNYGRRHFAKVLGAAGLAGRGYTPKNLRHSLASWLLSAGVPVAYVGELLGHADGGITAAKHYARWVPRGYVAPPTLADGELVVDFLARLTPGDPTVASGPIAEGA